MKFQNVLWLLLFFFIFPGSPSFAVTADEAYQSGLTYYKNGQWDQSILQFKASVLLDPNSWLAYQMLGYAYTQEANASEAMDACEKSMEINPNNPTLKNFIETTVKPHLYPSNNGGGPSSSPLASIPARDAYYLNLGAMSPLVTYSTTQTAIGTAIGVGYGFAIDKSFSLLLDGRFGALPRFIPIYGSAIPVTEINTLTFLGNAKCNIVSDDNPVVFYAIVGLGPSFYFGANSATYLTFRFGLGLDIRLNPGLALTFEPNLIVPATSDLYSLTSYGLKFYK